jgi:hypothetical protein
MCSPTATRLSVSPPPSSETVIKLKSVVPPPMSQTRIRSPTLTCLRQRSPWLSIQA